MTTTIGTATQMLTMDGRRELTDVLTSVFTDHCPPKLVEDSEGAMAAQLWEVLDDLGLTKIGIAEADNGSGGDLADVVTVLQVGARFAAPIPLLESVLLAPAVRHAFGAPTQPGPTTVVYDSSVRATQTGGAWRIAGAVSDVPYGHVVDSVLVLATDVDNGQVVMTEVAGADIEWSRRTDLAGVPRDGAQLDVAVTTVHTLALSKLPGLRTQLHDLHALGLTWTMVGAMEKVQALTVTYATEREQFGRAISKFQAVKQLAAQLAGEIIVARAGAIEATRELTERGAASFPVAAARARAGLAATFVSQTAHQLHGAIGYTREYPLHHYTRRLWVWRDEDGTTAQWLERAGERVMANGSDALWPTLTGR